eukprot:CAMPEP_0177650148 /NCGR_PEP_ID=MMETSP0447-20121125/11774_1 /TAXON_ID=0 /ORGANISM="Stygamoeba regulata, Strain BSH-02190019" /LENGTH=433 /DNA_ID=CAMNT_0019152971 /DNA_START=85 /DNA_END=1386 /DNA_ORIENTATION=-
MSPCTSRNTTAGYTQLGGLPHTLTVEPPKPSSLVNSEQLLLLHQFVTDIVCKNPEKAVFNPNTLNSTLQRTLQRISELCDNKPGGPTADRAASTPFALSVAAPAAPPVPAHVPAAPGLLSSTASNASLNSTSDFSASSSTPSSPSRNDPDLSECQAALLSSFKSTPAVSGSRAYEFWKGKGFTSPLHQLVMLQSWASTLDKLSPANKQMLWNTCRMVPSFQNYNLKSFRRTVGNWANSILPNIHCVTILFGAVGFLKHHGILKNEFYYPNTTISVFRTIHPTHEKVCGMPTPPVVDLATRQHTHALDAPPDCLALAQPHASASASLPAGPDGCAPPLQEGLSFPLAPLSTLSFEQLAAGAAGGGRGGGAFLDGTAVRALQMLAEVAPAVGEERRVVPPLVGCSPASLKRALPRGLEDRATKLPRLMDVSHILN